MPKKITEEQREKAVKALAQGMPEREAAAISGVSRATLRENGFKPQADLLKKEIRAAFEADTGTRIKDLASNFLSVVEDAVKKLNDGALDQCTGPQLALIAGIATDKMQLLTGGATDNVQISAGPRSDDFLRKLKAKSITIESAKIDPIINITQTETTDKTGKALKNEAKGENKLT